MADAILEALRRYDTPTVCNALEIVAPERQGYGYTTLPLVCAHPELPPMVGYARTVAVRAFRPSTESAEAQRDLRFSYLDYVADAPGPTISVAQDLDDARAGFGAFWGEVNSNMHWALGCIGTVTNGSVRDLDVIADGFQALAGVIAPSHGFIHPVAFAGEVNIAGMVVRSGDLIHADRHGAVVIPHDAAREVPAAAELMARREAVILDAAKAPGTTVDTIKQAMLDSAKVT